MSDHPFHGIALVIIRSGNGDWKVVTQHRLPKREPDISVRIRTIEKQLSYLSISNPISSDGAVTNTFAVLTQLYRNAQGESIPVVRTPAKDVGPYECVQE